MNAPNEQTLQNTRLERIRQIVEFIVLPNAADKRSMAFELALLINELDASVVNGGPMPAEWSNTNV